MSGVVTAVVTEISGSSPGKPGMAMKFTHKEGFTGTIGGGALEYRIQQLMLDAMEERESKTVSLDLSQNGRDGLCMVCGGSVTVEIKYFNDKNALPETVKDKAYIFGGGHISRELAPILTQLGFSCAIYDNMLEYANKKYFPENSETIHGEFDDITKHITISEKDYVIVLTRGHEHDFTVLKQVIPFNPRYIGVIGSKTKAATVSCKLIEAGFTYEEVNAIHSPIGLKINSVTPAEIAVSIAAQIVLIKRSNIPN
jgi:xanthine dehydrogenase accessory factor